MRLPWMRGVPRGGKALGLGDLLRGHPALDFIAITDYESGTGGRGSCGRETEPHVRLHEVLRDAAAGGIHAPEPPLRDDVAVLGGETIPPGQPRIALHFLSVILLNSEKTPAALSLRASPSYSNINLIASRMDSVSRP